jgi:hypothetical protein
VIWFEKKGLSALYGMGHMIALVRRNHHLVRFHFFVCSLRVSSLVGAADDRFHVGHWFDPGDGGLEDERSACFAWGC